MDERKYDDLLEQANSEQKKGGWNAALSYLKDCINKTPNCLEVYLVRGKMYTQKGDVKEALNDFEVAIKIDPNVAKSYYLRGLLFAESDGSIDKALGDFSRSIELDANVPYVYTHRANIYLKKNEFQKTIGDCTKAIELSPNDNKFPYSFRGRAYAEIGEFTKAIEDFSKAIELPPDSTSDYDSRGSVYVKMGEFTKALDDVNKVIEIDPGHADAYCNRGSLHAQLGNVQEAINDLEKFLELDPNNEGATEVQHAIKKLKSGKDIDDMDLSEINVKLKKRRIVLLVFTAIGIIIGAIAGGTTGGIQSVLIVGIALGIFGALLGLGIIPWLKFAKTALLGILTDFKFIIDSSTPVEGENWYTLVGDIIAAIVETVREKFLWRLGFVLLRLLFWWWILLYIYLLVSPFVGIYQCIKLLLERRKIKRNG